MLTRDTKGMAIEAPTDTPRLAESPKDGEQDGFQESWRYWKKRQGSAEHQNRKLSSIDPLEAPQGQIEPVQALGTLISREPVLLDGATVSNATIHDGKPEISWLQYLNPMSYLPPETFNFPQGQYRESQQQQRARSQSELSSQSNSQGWFRWFGWNSRRDGDDELIHDLQSSTEIKKNLKDVKKAVQSQDSIWAWYHLSGTEARGEASVLGTKTETSPVEMKKYPNTIPSSLSEESCTILPTVEENYREITVKTKVRLATELYYNYPAERHIYLKRHTNRPIMESIIIISVVAQSKTKNNLIAKKLSDLTSESVKNWLKDNRKTHECRIETISLEAAKVNDNTTENIMKLLINWRENLKNADCVIVVGFKNSFPLATSLLDTMISRDIVNTKQKFGLVSVDGTIPGPYLEDQEASTISYSRDFQTVFSKIIHNYDVKVTVVGTLNNSSASLALHLEHANIFRTMYFPKCTYNNEFEIQLFQLLLMAHNLGQESCRLLLQLSKYFTSSPISSDEMHLQMFIAPVYICLSTTRLIKPRPVRLNIVKDPILNNNYNLIWNLHAFMDNFKKISHIDAPNRIKKLLECYKTWDPQTKQLKDLKYMFEVLKIEDYSHLMVCN
jgi:hypothetical protein